MPLKKVFYMFLSKPLLKENILFNFLAGTLFSLLLYFSFFAFFINGLISDFVFTITPDNHSPSEEVAIIGIDNSSLDKFSEPMVLWHKYFAEVIRGAVKGGAKGIGLDVIIATSITDIAPQLEKELFGSLRFAKDKGIPVFLGFSLGNNGMAPDRRLPFFADGIGYLNLFPGPDETIREMETFRVGSQGNTAFAIAAQMANLQSSNRRDGLPQRMIIDYRNEKPPIYSFQKIFRLSKAGQVDELRKHFENKRIFIGLTSPRLNDHHLAPRYAMEGRNNRLPGVLIHAMATKTLLQKNPPRDIPNSIGWPLSVFFGVLTGWAFMALSPFAAFGLFLGEVVFYMAISILCLQSGWVMPFGLTGSLMLGFGLTCAMWRLAKTHWENRQLSQALGQYVHPEIARLILADPETLTDLEGEHKVLTVMFTDIRQFSSICKMHRDSPQAVLRGLNRYFAEMVEVIEETGGYLNRTVGDGILAFFGAPNPLPNDGAEAAVRCGLEMLHRVEKLNHESRLFPEWEHPLQIGVGIHTGGAIVSNVGGKGKLEYSIVGHTANLAARIESETKAQEVDLLVSESTWKRISDRADLGKTGSFHPKNMDEEVKIFEVKGLEADV